MTAIKRGPFAGPEQNWPDGAIDPRVSRRRLLGAAAGLAAATPGQVRAEAAGDSLRKSGAVRRSTQERPSELPSLADFGAVGDSRSDDSAAIQAALDWAGSRPGTRLHVPPRVFGIRKPLLIPENVELLGELPGSGNTGLCGFRALSGFSSPYSMRFGVGGELRRMPIAALLISRGWTENCRFSHRLHLRDLFFDVDSLTDARGAPIHGLLLANQQLDVHNVWIRSSTGFGLWLNTQCPDGAFASPLVDNVLRRVWVRGAGVGGATFTTEAGVLRFGGYLIGALPGARDPWGASEPAIATDGILDYCTVAVGPEAGVGCRGNGIHVTHSAGWRVAACHVNGAGRHGVVLERAFQTELSGNYLDGWGVDVNENEGTFGCIWCSSAMAVKSGGDGGLILASNRIRARAVGMETGNQFVALTVRAGQTPTPRAVVIGNVFTKRRDAAHPVAAFDFGRVARGELDVVVLGNSIAGASTTFLQQWNEAAVRPRFSGNSFQYAAAAPYAGWHPSGLRVENAGPTEGGWSGWVNLRSGEPGLWKGYAQIEA